MESEAAGRPAFDQAAAGKCTDAVRRARRRLAGQGGGGVQPEVSARGGPEDPEDALVPRCQLPVGDFESREDAAGGIPALRATRVHVLQFVDQLV